MRAIQGSMVLAYLARLGPGQGFFLHGLLHATPSPCPSAARLLLLLLPAMMMMMMMMIYALPSLPFPSYIPNLLQKSSHPVVFPPPSYGRNPLWPPPSRNKKIQKGPIKSPSNPPPHGSRSHHPSFVYSALAVNRPAPPDCDSALRPTGAFQDHHHHHHHHHHHLSTTLAGLCSA
ncbi:uncharacterized protein IWZ02DRAFT_308887 [Phyllosticta citriasiana]|uniref:uncharacterized protein n=1 Tax=Phyllosticta citriasiana TaxID=595635 RepID=UPI0030FD9652